MGAIKLYHMIGMGGEGENKNVSVCNRQGENYWHCMR